MAGSGGRMSPVNRVFPLLRRPVSPCPQSPRRRMPRMRLQAAGRTRTAPHEGRRSRTIAEASATTAVSLGAPGAAVHYYPNPDMAIQAALGCLGEPPVLLSRVERRSPLPGQRNAPPAEPLLCRVDGNGIIDLGHWQELLGQRPGWPCCRWRTRRPDPCSPLSLPRPPARWPAYRWSWRLRPPWVVPLPACSWLGLVADARDGRAEHPACWWFVREPAIERPDRDGSGRRRTRAGECGRRGRGRPGWRERSSTSRRPRRDIMPGRPECGRKSPPSARRAVHGSATDHLPYLVALSALYVDGEALLLELDRRGFCSGQWPPAPTTTVR